MPVVAQINVCRTRFGCSNLDTEDELDSDLYQVNHMQEKSHFQLTKDSDAVAFKHFWTCYCFKCSDFSHFLANCTVLSISGSELARIKVLLLPLSNSIKMI